METGFGKTDIFVETWCYKYTASSLNTWAPGHKTVLPQFTVAMVAAWNRIYENSACLLLGTPLDKLSFDKVYIFPCLGVAVFKNKNI